ncbi:gas vesicle protein [Streptomyces aculeolatus]
MTAPAPREERDPQPQRQASLVDLLDRLLGAGVAVSGDLVLRVADVDLVSIRLHALLASTAAPGAPWPGDGVAPAHRGGAP